MSILVIGVGNVLLTDEGIGVRTLEALEQRYTFSDGPLGQKVELLDGGTAGMELMEIMARRDHVILLDAVNTGAEPGTLVTLEDDEVPALFRSRISPHQLGISDLLGVMSLTGELPKRFTLFGAVPFSIDTGIELSAEMATKVDPLVEQVVTKLATLGVEAKPRQNAAATGFEHRCRQPDAVWV